MSTSRGEKREYRLTGVICHLGERADSGHYTAYTRYSSLSSHCATPSQSGLGFVSKFPCIRLGVFAARARRWHHLEGWSSSCSIGKLPIGFFDPSLRLSIQNGCSKDRSLLIAHPDLHRYNDEWYKYDDAKIEKVDIGLVTGMSQSAYMFLYEDVSRPNIPIQP